MHVVFRAALSIAVALGLCAASPAQDRVILKDGSVLEGKVKSVSSDRVVMDAGGIVVPLKRAEIAEIDLRPDRTQHTEFELTVPTAKPAAAQPAAETSSGEAAPHARKSSLLAAERSTRPPAESIAMAPLPQLRLSEMGAEPESGWGALLQNRFGLDPHDPAKLLLYAAIAFALVTLVVALSARLADLYRRSPNRITGFSACTILLVIPQIVWLPSDPALIGCAIAADFLVWCLLVRWIFSERLLKSCVLLVGSAFIILLVALAGEVGRMMLAKGAAGSGVL